MSKIRTKIFGVIVTFVVFLMAAVLSLSLPAAQEVTAATGEIPYLAPVYDTDGNVTFDENGNVIMQEKTIADGTYTLSVGEMVVQTLIYSIKSHVYEKQNSNNETEKNYAKALYNCSVSLQRYGEGV